MPYRSRQNNILRCANCGGENYVFAAFCISCGEPFDTAPDPYSPTQPSKLEPGGEPALQEQTTSTLSSRLARREAIIGIVLVALALVYAIYTWQRNNAESAAYKEGVVAEQHKDWDKASTAFDKAGDQRDASSRATHAHIQVAERNRLYSEAIVAVDRQDWKAALSAFEGVQAIQPSFADSASKLVQVRSQAVKLELGDLVYLVSDGPDTGLYILDETDTPYHLPGSDALSAIHAMSPDGARFVYDREKSYTDSSPAPGPDSKGLINHAPTLPNAFNDATAKRIPVLVTANKGKVTTRPMPNLNGSGMGIFSQKGLWWYSGWYSSPRDANYFQYEVAYNSDEQTSALSTVVVTNPFSNTRVLAVDPQRSRLALGQAQGEARSVNRETRLYLANADGTEPRFIQAIEGDVQSASISRDGHWLLIITQYLIAHVGIEKSVWLAPLETGAADATARKLETLAGIGTDIPPHVSAALVPTDKLPTRAVVDLTSSNLEHVAFYSADSNALTYILYSLPGETVSDDIVGFSNNGAYLGLRRQYGPDARLEMVSLGKDDFLHSWSLPLPAQIEQNVRVIFAPNDNYVLASVQDLSGPRGGFIHKIYSAHISKKGGLEDMKLIARAATQSDTVLPAIATATSGSMLAYVNAQHELHVTFYDGANDTMITDKVSAVWALGQNDDHSWVK